MQWEKTFTYVQTYEVTSSNQHGARYRQAGTKRLSAARLTAETTNATNMRTLILLSHHLDTPVRYDFSTDPQTAYIEVVSEERLKKARG